MMLKCMVIVLGFVFALTVPFQVPVVAQTIITNDDTTLKQIIIFGRHSIRSSVTPSSDLAMMAPSPYPPFEVATGCLTPNGSKAETLFGTYYRQYLLFEGLLTGNDHTDAAHSYFRSNSIERSWMTADAFGNGLIPPTGPPVHSLSIGQTDPVFDPIAAGVADVNAYVAATQVQEMFGSGTILVSDYNGEYSLLRSVLFDYPLGTQPPPPAPYCGTVQCLDPANEPIPLTANNPPYQTGNVINIGGLEVIGGAADPFIMQYADGFPLDQVAWDRLTFDQLSQQTRTVMFGYEIEITSPYLNQVQSSNAASHILRTMQQAVSGSNLRGAFGNAGSKTVVVISSDIFVAGLAGLLHLHWQLPGYQPDFCSPGGALVFELRQSNSSKQYIVRIYYTSQTLDQLRNLTVLALNEPPATMQLLVPDGSISATNLDVNWSVFVNLMENAIGRQYVQNPSKEIQPGILTNVTCQ